MTSLIHPLRVSGAAPLLERRTMSPTVGLRQITRVVADGTGRSPDEVVLLTAATSAVVATVAAARVVIWAVDLVTDLDLWPTPPGR
jgi:hypothetical protein